MALYWDLMMEMMKVIPDRVEASKGMWNTQGTCKHHTTSNQAWHLPRVTSKATVSLLLLSGTGMVISKSIRDGHKKHMLDAHEMNYHSVDKFKCSTYRRWSQWCFIGTWWRRQWRWCLTAWRRAKGCEMRMRRAIIIQHQIKHDTYWGRLWRRQSCSFFCWGQGWWFLKA